MSSETLGLGRTTDFAVHLYTHPESARNLKNKEQIVDDLWTLWAEYDLKPSPVRYFVRENGLKDKDNNDVVAWSQAASKVRKGRVEESRIEAELLGVVRLREMILSSNVSDGVILLSPPGSEQEGFGAEGRRRLSFTYLYHKGKQGRIHFLAVPIEEVPAIDHFQMLDQLVDINNTHLLNQSNLESFSDRELVAYPFAVKNQNSLDEMSRRLGYKSLIDLWKSALEAKRARNKAKDLILHVAGEIWEAIQTDEVQRQDALGEVFRGVVALLSGPGLDDVEDVNQYFDSKVRAMIVGKESSSLGSPIYPRAMIIASNEDLMEFLLRIRRNPYAMDRIESGQCSGDRGIDWGGIDTWRRMDPWSANNVIMDLWGPRSELEVMSASTTSTGKYTDYYNYEPGVCKKCGQHKQYVAHAKREGEPCGGWCSDCEK